MRLIRQFQFRWGMFFIAWLAAVSPCIAQCRFQEKTTGRVFTYTFDPTVTAEGTVLHVTLKFQGNAEGAEEISVPKQWAGQKLHEETNLRTISSDTVLTETADEGGLSLRYPANQQVVLAYDMVKDWTGRFNHPMQFHGVLLPEYIEINGSNTLVYPKTDRQAPVTVNFDWQRIPAAWVLATSFGTSSGPEDRCQSYSGPWSGVKDALFTAGVFRIHRFQIGDRPAVLAIRDQWTFTDEEAIAQIQKAVGIVRDFWHDDNFPYFLVTLKAFDNDSGSGDGSAFTNAFWMYLSHRDPISSQLPTLAHETFHTWNPRRMGAISVTGDGQSIEWFHEGFTTYYGYLLVYRASLMPLSDYLESVNQDLRNYPTSKSPYVRGRAIATWLDWQIRKTSNNKSSLDNVMFDMVREADKPLTVERILQTAGRYLAPADQAQLRRAVEQNAFPQMEGATFGPCVKLTIDDVPTFDLGFDFAASSEARKVTGVDPDGPAYKAGLRDGQVLAGRISIYDGRTDKTAIFTIQTDAGRKAIEYYPLGKAVATPQFHLDQAAYSANQSACRMQ